MAARRRVEGKKELTETLFEQLSYVANGVSFPDGSDGTEPITPHVYLKIWLACKRFGGGMTSAPILPGPGSYFEQDAELMLAFEILEELWAEEQANKTGNAPPPPSL